VKVLGVVIALITIAGGTVSLLFHLRPGLEPCVGGSSAEFTGAPVFPRMKFRDHLFHTGVSKQDIARQPDVVGAEIRYSYRVNNLKGADLPLISSVVTVDHGEVTGIVAEEDRALARLVSPSTCTETGGQDLFVFIPDPKKHYRVVLELYRDQARTDRLALFETPTFSG
jgi:hypothetical protein